MLQLLTKLINRSIEEIILNKNLAIKTKRSNIFKIKFISYIAEF